MYFLIMGLFINSVESYSFSLFFSFYFNQVSFTLNADAQVLPSQFAPPSISNDTIFLCVSNTGTGTLFKEDFIFGMPAVERFYAVLDTSNARIGLAYTSFTNGTFNTAT